MSPRRVLPVLFSLLLLPACGGDTTTDSGVDAGADMSAADEGVDVPLVPSTLYGPCMSDAECPGADGTPGGGVCRTSSQGWNYGYCTLPCSGPTDDLPCNDAIVNYCADLDGDGSYFCERRCQNGIDCMRDHYTCGGYMSSMGEGVCIGVCATDDDCGPGGICGAGGRCASRHVSGGMPDGSACSNASTCASQGCILGALGGVDGLYWPNIAGLGFLGGYCTQTCTLPGGYNSTNFFSGPDLPQGDCPTSEVCFPMDFPASTFVSAPLIRMGTIELVNSRTAMGDAGFCAATCTSDVECRPGYQCFGLGTFSAGVCVPGCSRRMCPAGNSCLTDSSGNAVACAASTAPPDAGTMDSGTTDAGTPDAGTPDAGADDAATTD